MILFNRNEEIKRQILENLKYFFDLEQANFSKSSNINVGKRGNDDLLHRVSATFTIDSCVQIRDGGKQIQGTRFGFE